MAHIFETVVKATEMTKQLLELSAVTEDPQAKLVVADLQSQLAEFKRELMRLFDMNAELRRQIEMASSDVTGLTLKNGAYYKTGVDGVFCPKCFDSNRLLIRVTELPGVIKLLGRWRCNVCKRDFG
jgi:hypothetical protein